MVVNFNQDQPRNGGPRGKVTWHWPHILKAAGPKPQSILLWVCTFTIRLCNALCSIPVLGSGDLTRNKTDKSPSPQSLYSDIAETINKQTSQYKHASRKEVV